MERTGLRVHQNAVETPEEHRVHWHVNNVVALPPQGFSRLRWYPAFGALVRVLLTMGLP